MGQSSDFEIRFTPKEVSAWGGLALLKRMTDGLGLKQAMTQWHLPAPGSNRGYAPAQLLEQMPVRIWTGANCFAQAGFITKTGRHRTLKLGHSQTTARMDHGSMGRS